MISIFLICLIIAKILYMAFNTDAIPHYLNLIPSDYWRAALLTRSYLATQYPANERKPSYFAFLFNAWGYDGFLKNLLICDLCVTVWLSAIYCYIVGNFWILGAVYFGSVISYRILVKVLNFLK